MNPNGRVIFDHDEYDHAYHPGGIPGSRSVMLSSTSYSLCPGSSRRPGQSVFIRYPPGVGASGTEELITEEQGEDDGSLDDGTGTSVGGVIGGAGIMVDEPPTPTTSRVGGAGSSSRRKMKVESDLLSDANSFL